MGTLPARTEHSAAVVRPDFARFARTVSIAVGAAVIPPFAALYWLTFPTGAWMGVFAIHKLALLVLAAAAIRVRYVVIKIDGRGVRKRGYFGRLLVTPQEDVGSILILQLLAASTAEVTTQLFVLDRHGRTRARMRGQYWSHEAMETVEHALDVPVQRLPEPLTGRELRMLHGRNLYWHERHPALTFAGGAILVAAVAAPVFLMLESLL